jgi:hypothetical protein
VLTLEVDDPCEHTRIPLEEVSPPLDQFHEQALRRQVERLHVPPESPEGRVHLAAVVAGQQGVGLLEHAPAEVVVPPLSDGPGVRTVMPSMTPMFR